MTDIGNLLPPQDEPQEPTAPSERTVETTDQVVSSFDRSSVVDSALSRFGIDSSAAEAPPVYPTPVTPAPVQQSSGVVGNALAAFGIETEAPARIPGAPVQTAYGTINAPEMEGQAAQEFVTALTANALPSWEADPAQLRRVAAFTTQLWHYGIASGDQDMIDAATSFRSRASDILPPEIQAEYGLDIIPVQDSGPGGFLGGIVDIGEAVPGTWLERFGAAVGVPVLNMMNSPSQGVMTAIGTVRANPTQARAWWTGAQAFSQGLTYGNVGNALEELGLVDEHDEQGILKAARENIDNDGDGELNWREVLGLDAESGGRVAGLFDTILVGIFDPLTWVGLGPAGRARAGLTAVAATQGDEAARAVARGGLGQLDDRARSEVETFMRSAISQSQSARRQGLWSRLGLADDTVQSQVDAQLRALQGGVGAISIAGNNVRIPMFDSAVYTLRPGYGRGLSRMGSEARDIFDPEIDVDGTFTAANTLFNGVDNVVTLSDDEVSARIAGNAAGGSTSAGVSISGKIIGDSPVGGNWTRWADEAVPEEATVHGTITRVLTDDRSAELIVEMAEGADLGLASARILRDVKALEEQGFHTIRVSAPGESPVYWASRGFVPDSMREDLLTDWFTTVDERLDEVIAQIDGAAPAKTVPYVGRPDPNIEMVPTRVLDDITPGNELRPDVDLDALADDLLENGFENPVIVGYDKEGRTVFIGEGNHRVAAARLAGITEIPTVVSRRTYDPTGRGTPVRGYTAGGHVPGELKLSDVMDIPVDDLVDTLPVPAQLSLGDVGVEALIPPNQQKVVLQELKQRVAAVLETPNSANIGRAVDPNNRAGWDELGRIIGGFDEFPPLPLLRGIGAHDALRVIEAGGRRLGQRVADTRFGRRFSQAFRPRSDLQSALGDYAEEAFDAARVLMDSRMQRNMDDLLRRIESAANRAARAMGTLDEADRVLRNEVLEAPEAFGMSSYESAMYHIEHVIRGEYGDEMADYAAAVVRVRAEIDDMAAKNGLETLRESYFPRTLTAAGREAILDSPNADEALRRLGLDPTKIRGHEGRFHNPRTFMPNATIDEANRELARILDLPPGTILFEDNVLAAFATRGYAAYKAAAQLDGLKQLADEFVTVGGQRKAMVIDLQPGMRVPDGYRVLNDIDSGRFVALREVADEIERFYRVLTNDEAMRKLHQGIDKWSQTWGMYATAPLIDGFGFHSRNAAGNVLLNATAGIGPQWYPRALKVQRDLAQVFRHMRDNGVGFEDAMDALELPDIDRELFRQLRDQDVVNSGWFDQMVRDADDAARPRASRESDLTPRRGAGRLLNTYDGSWDFLQNNTLVRTGRALGTAVESNARIAHFMARVNAGDTPQQAARSMRKFLFDYGDLTEVERRLRMLSRFYTFMRKNASVQLWALTRYPGRLHAIQRAVSGGDPGAGIMGFGFGGVFGQPDYSTERGDNIPLIGGLIGGVETPFQAFAESFWSPIMTFGSMASGDVDRREFLGSLLALTSGGPRSVFDNLMIDIAKYNPSFNREATERELGYENVAVRWLESAGGPFYSQIERMVQRLSNTEGVGFIGNDPSRTVQHDNWAVLLYSNILGMNVARIDEPDEVERDTLWLLDQELRDMLDGLRKNDATVPTIDDLRRLGLIPEVERGAARAGSVVTQETIDRLEESGLDIDLTPLYAELDERLAAEAERGVIISEDGTYTDRIGRLREFSVANGVLTEGGNGSTSTAMKVLWNQQNPADPFINPDTGRPYDEYDVPVRWDDVSEDQVLEWAREVGAPLTRRGNVGKQTQEAWNRAFPDNPYYGEYRDTEEKLRAGLRPLQGILVWTAPDGTEREYGPRTPLSEVLFGN